MSEQNEKLKNMEDDEGIARIKWNNNMVQGE